MRPIFFTLLLLLTAQQGFSGIVSMENRNLRIVFDDEPGTIQCEDKRIHKVWKQERVLNDVLISDAHKSEKNAITFNLSSKNTGDLKFNVTLTLGNTPETSNQLLLTIDGSGEMNKPLLFPHPFQTGKGQSIILPRNEGIRVPTDDHFVFSTNHWRRFNAYVGHDLTLSFYGLIDDTTRSGVMTTITTPDDAFVNFFCKKDGLHTTAQGWEPSLGEVRYARQLCYTFFTDGGYVAMAKAHRDDLKNKGWIKTLSEKQADNPNVAKMAGAANIWYWDFQTLDEAAQEMHDAGLDRAIWSKYMGPGAITKLNGLGYITSCYDNPRDIMNLQELDDVKWVPQAGVNWNAWPQDVMRNRDGTLTTAWPLPSRKNSDKEIKMYACSDTKLIKYARERLNYHLAGFPYTARFYDVLSAMAFAHENWNPNDRYSRSEARIAIGRLLEYASQEHHLIIGGETGTESLINKIHFSEGMQLVEPFRPPDAWDVCNEIYETRQLPPRELELISASHRYQIPLWELVFHDCFISYHRFQFPNNKLHCRQWWDRQDLNAVLFGQPQMFVFPIARAYTYWQDNRDRLIKSYKHVSSAVRQTFASEMLTHEYLTDNCDVQQVTYANGIRIIVNYGDTPFEHSELNKTVPPFDYLLIPSAMPKGAL